MNARVRRVITAAAATAAALFFTSGSAIADTTGRVSDVNVDGSGHLSFTMTAPGLPAGAGLDPSAVRLTIDGRRIPVTAGATEVHKVAADPTTAMLVIDTSGSMHGRGIVAARHAARQFLAAAPANVAIGLETFSSRPQLLVPPTTDRQRVVAALSGLRAAGETALYDALVLAADSASGGKRRLIAISDGADTVSRTSLTTALGRLHRRDVTVEVVGLRTAEADNAVLRQVAAATNGRFVFAGNGAALAAALRSSARSYATAISVQTTVPTDLWGDDRRLAVAVASSAGTVAARAVADIGSVAHAAPITVSKDTSKQLLWGGLGAVALALLLGAAALFGDDAMGRRRARQLVGHYSMNPQPETSGASSITRTALDIADKVAQSRGLSDRLTSRITRAGLSLTPSEWLLLQVGIVFVTALMFVLFGMAPAVAAIAGLVVGPILGHLFLSIRFSRRRAAFVAALPDTLQLIAGSLSAGYSLAQSLDGVVSQGEQPISGEFGRALAESRLGVPIERTLESVAERMDSEDFRWVVLAIQIQHKVGGNLAEVLLTVAQTMRERVQLHRHVKALSAEGRLSAYILVGLPVFFTLYLFSARGEYLRPLYTTRMGLVMIAMAFILLGIGSLVMKKMVKVEV